MTVFEEIQKREDAAYERGVTDGWAEAITEVRRGEPLPEFRAAYDAQMKERATS